MYVLLLVASPDFNLFCSTTSRLSVTDHFRTGAVTKRFQTSLWNDPKMANSFKIKENIPDIYLY